MRVVNAERGRELFHNLGCVACHAPDPSFTPPLGRPAEGAFTHRSVPFPDWARKYSLGTLADFLRDPLKVRPDGRMPRFALEEEDVADLAGYLLAFPGGDGTTDPGLAALRVDARLAAKGREWVTKARCTACHALPADAGGHPVTPIANGREQGGCLAPAPAPGLPRYALADAQRLALQQFLRDRATRKPSAAETAQLSLEALNCAACHERDGRGGPDAARQAYFQGDENLGEAGRLPPPLTGIGRKLQPTWFARVLAGDHRLRPYVRTQMPVFGPAATNLPALLATVDARPSPPLPAGDGEAGRKLVGAGGLNCITCHRWGNRPSLGIPGLDLSRLGERLQVGWLHEYLLNPAGYRPGTLMPSFWPDGVAANPNILGGDTARQVASIHAYARGGSAEPEGYPATKGGQFELVPAARPIVQRAFVEGVGTHAILVGFPAGVHIAYDGLRGRPALAWRGKFFDAYTTWYARFVPFEKPLGDSVVRWPTAVGSKTGGVEFAGYRLDAGGVPTFLLRVRGERVEERLEPADGGLRRILRGEATALARLPVTHPDGVRVTEEAGAGPGTRRFTYLWP
jgi:mono/diheme cytochrome c family protein